ncbi:MAG: hypothetical protein KatS3mg068_0588 [Candidatus Sericytochromatia bacterium]|nr:MAG: hypothetical protein KatS3mg068_0588 [Candidatus Sericytochromatia bacterium]
MLKSELNKEIAKTKTGAIIIAHDDTKEQINSKKTKYLCGHVFRIATEIKNKNICNLKYNGFIHISENAKEEQYFDVLGLIIKGYSYKLNKNPVNILVSGFTKFGKVLDNPTSRFLFNDGTSDNYGLIEPDFNKIDSMMKNKFDNCIKNSTYDNELNISYNCKLNDKIKDINLFFVRLPVYDNLLKEDKTRKIFEDAINLVNPDAIISFGAGTNGIENYYIEITSYGMKENGAIYDSDDEFITNYDLLEILKFHKLLQ